MAGDDKHPLQPEGREERSAAIETGVSRRRFLSQGAAATALVLGAPAAALAHDHGHQETAEAPPSPAQLEAIAKADAAHFEQFSEPPIATGVGEVNVTLRVAELPVTIRESTVTRTETTRTYNGQVPGPTIVAFPGDKINVRLYNELPKNSDSACASHGGGNPNTPHCFNTTNLHTHGLHVSPKVPSDNVFLEIPPLAEDPVKGRFDFCFALPTFHKPGTHWYHAHKHGSTAIQLVNGMAGALIVKDKPERYPGIKDVVIIIHEIVGNKDEDVYQCQSGCGTKSSFLVNGQYQPTISIRPGEIQRWRFINATATPRGITNLTFTTAQTLIAVDGIYLPSSPVNPRSVTSFPLAPGNRLDFLVQFKSTGTFPVSKQKIPFPGCEIPEQTLLKVNVAGPMLDMTLPTEMSPLPQYLQKTLDASAAQTEAIVAPDQTIVFNVANQPDCAGKFQINGAPFGPTAPPITVPLGATQVWQVENSTSAPHPFHIHVNPFVVIEKDGKPVKLEEQYLQDTVLIRPRQNNVNGSVKFRTSFDTFDGEFVIHCHILIHEDWGMMRKVVVQGKGIGPCTFV